MWRGRALHAGLGARPTFVGTQCVAFFIDAAEGWALGLSARQRPSDLGVSQWIGILASCMAQAANVQNLWFPSIYIYIYVCIGVSIIVLCVWP